MSTATTEPAPRLRCPRCGASLAPDQDWCLECGAAATTRILRPPSWKLAAAVVLGVVALVIIALVIVVNGLSGDAHRAAGAGARRPAAVATPAQPAATPSARTTPATSSSTPAIAGALASWPTGRAAWTVVLATASSRATAERLARAEVGKGVKAGVLDTSRFDVAANGARFVVFTGQFRDQGTAVAEESRLGGSAPGSAFVAQVSPH